MKHDFIDKHSHLDSMIHRLDPRVKLLLAPAFLVLTGMTYNLVLFALYYAVMLVLMVLSRVPPGYYLKRLLVVTPLVVVLSFFIYLSYLLKHRIPVSMDTLARYYPVMDTLVLLVLKIYISLLCITLLISSTPFNDLLWGFRKYRMPQIVTTLSKLVYTYLFVFVDELHRTLRAYRGRTPKRRVPLLKVYGNIAAGIFLRSLERSDVIYKAMLSRGFNGEFPEGNIHRFGGRDLAAVGFGILFGVFVGVIWNI